MFSKSFYYIIFFSRKCFYKKKLHFQKHLYHVKKMCFQIFVFSKKLIFLFFFLKRNPNFAKKRGNAFKKCVFITLKNVFTCEIFYKKNFYLFLKKKSEKMCFQNVFYFLFFYIEIKMFSSFFIKI